MHDLKVSKPPLSQPTKDGSYVYMWISHYADNTSLPQYDPYTLETHTFSEVEQDKLIKFGLYPFPSTLAKRLRDEKGLNVKSNIFLPKYEVDIDDDKRVIGALTTNFIEHTSYIVCPSCGQSFKKGQISTTSINVNDKTYICPKCGERSYWVCSNCKRKYSSVDETDDFHCHDCKTRLNINRAQFKIYTVENRWRIYKLGYQQTINGVNHKVIMHIHENGDVELKNK